MKSLSYLLCYFFEYYLEAFGVSSSLKALRNGKLETIELFLFVYILCIKMKVFNDMNISLPLGVIPKMKNQ